jgi:hypothetical protein
MLSISFACSACGCPLEHGHPDAEDEDENVVGVRITIGPCPRCMDSAEESGEELGGNEALRANAAHAEYLRELREKAIRSAWWFGAVIGSTLSFVVAYLLFRWLKG